MFTNNLRHIIPDRSFVLADNGNNACEKCVHFCGDIDSPPDTAPATFSMNGEEGGLLIFVILILQFSYLCLIVTEVLLQHVVDKG